MRDERPATAFAGEMVPFSRRVHAVKTGWITSDARLIEDLGMS